MCRHAARFGLLIVFAFVWTGLAQASNWAFLKGSAVAQFTEQDVQLMMENAEAVANDATIPLKREWRNPATGHSGAAESVSAFVGPDREPCKRLRISNAAGTRRGEATYTVCRFEEGGWRLVPNDYGTGATKTTAP